jgi:hypothetical protein
VRLPGGDVLDARRKRLNIDRRQVIATSSITEPTAGVNPQHFAAPTTLTAQVW